MIQQRLMDQQPVLKSNNPFRKSSASSARSGGSPFDEFFDSGVPVRTERSHSAGLVPGGPSVSFAPQTAPQRIMAMQGYSLSDQDVSTGVQRRQPLPPRNNMFRKSSNPFIEDPVSDNDSFNEDDEADPIFRAPPQRPPSSSKPRAAGSSKDGVVVSTRPFRSNSDSSVLEPTRHQTSTRESRDGSRSHRDHHHRDGRKDRDGHRDHRSSSDRRDKKEDREKSSRKKDGSSRRKGQPLDVIDKLDVTGLFGPGSFHHDGPFDACTPHRNKNTRKAPVAAFPIDGANNSLSVNDSTRDRYATENSILGRSVDEAYLDYSNGGGNYRPAPPVERENGRGFNPALKETPVHGDITMGLGSSTFLDGTPASREAIAKSNEEALTAASGLGRKKSLVQRLRGGTAPPARPVPPRTTKGSVSPDPSSAPVARTISHPIESTNNSLNRNGGAGTAASPPPQSYLAPGAGAGTGGGAGGLLRRVKSLKVGAKRRNS